MFIARRLLLHVSLAAPIMSDEEILRTATSTPIPGEGSAEERQLLGEVTTQPSSAPMKSHHVRTSSRSSRRSRTPGGSRTRNELDSLPPTSCAQIFRNLLVIEESFRIQYKELSISRRKNVVFFSVLLTAMLYFLYAVFISPSFYRLFSFIDRIGFLASTITMGLFYLTGLYSKTFMEYPRFVYSANKGLRVFNVKLVKVPKTWKERIISLLWDPGYMCRPGRLVKIVLSTRVFSSETIEGWEIYRQEYWEREFGRATRRSHNRQHSIDTSKKPNVNRKRASSTRTR